MKGAGDRLGGLLGLVHLDDLLGDVREEAGIVLLLEGEAAEILAFDLADQHDDRCRVVIGGMEGDEAVREAGPARHHGDAGSLAQPPVRHRHEAGACLVAAHHDTDRVALDERAGEPNIALAGHAIDLVDVVRFEAFRQEAGDGSAHRRLLAVYFFGDWRIYRISRGIVLYWRRRDAEPWRSPGPPAAAVGR
jgi:hypothetical protein